MSAVTHTVTEGGCWVCTSHKLNRNGYPYTGGGRRKLSPSIAKRMYQQTFGPVPVGTVLRHTCDNPLCVNPSHLIPGTHADNVADRVRRGRSAIGIRNGRSKLTPEMVRLIRESTEGTTALALRFGVDRKVIRNVQQGKSWRSVT